MNIIKTQLTFAESMKFVNGIIDGVFIQDEEGKDIDYSPATLLPLIQSTFVEMYTDYVFEEDFNANFAVYMAVDIDNLIVMNAVNKTQYSAMLEAINEGVQFRKQKLIHNQKSSIDEMFDSLTTLLSTLNTKASELDTKKLEKIIKKLNPQELVKAYEKSNIGNSLRDKTIQDLAKKNKELKNKESARNVVVDKKVD